MSRGDVLLYTVLPYAAISVFVVGHLWRYRRDQLTWTARSTQLLESRVLRIGSIVFHLGVLAAIGGHVLGILVPASWTDAVGVSEDAYHVISVAGGLTAGLAVLVGFTVLMWRRAAFHRVRETTRRSDVIVFGLLAAGILTGMAATLVNAFGDPVDYRETVAPYFRRLLMLDPEPELMAEASLVFQVHLTVVWVLYAYWPFSRLVHAWSLPVGYFGRAPILYRRRSPARLARPPAAPASLQTTSTSTAEQG